MHFTIGKHDQKFFLIFPIFGGMHPNFPDGGQIFPQIWWKI